MASPPFSLNTSLPGNSDIASQFPTLDRSDKDVVQSWLLIQMNSYGHDLYTLIDKVGSANGPSGAPAPSANTIALYYDTDNALKQWAGDLATVEYVGVPPGSVFPFAGSSAPAGYLLCAGQPVSRTTYARLFTAIGSTYGNGDGSTTFNVPDLRGRAPYGQDNMGGAAAQRITASSGNFDGTVLGSAGGNQAGTTTITQGMLPNVNLSSASLGVSASTSGIANFCEPANECGAGDSNLVVSGTLSATAPTTNFFALTTSASISGSVPLGGSGTPTPIIANALIMTYIIKF